MGATRERKTRGRGPNDDEFPKKKMYPLLLRKRRGKLFGERHEKGKLGRHRVKNCAVTIGGSSMHDRKEGGGKSGVGGSRERKKHGILRVG